MRSLQQAVNLLSFPTATETVADPNHCGPQPQPDVWCTSSLAAAGATPTRDGLQQHLHKPLLSNVLEISVGASTLCGLHRHLHEPMLLESPAPHTHPNSRSGDTGLWSPCFQPCFPRVSILRLLISSTPIP